MSPLDGRGHRDGMAESRSVPTLDSQLDFRHALVRASRGSS